ncbi:MAG: ribosome maturation factor RimP [Clostridia bacterium]|nr:ribosome maturation factor RimP [Clostridia bacterium]
MNVKPLQDIRTLLEAIAAPMGIEVVDVEFKQGKAPAMTVFIDTPTGVDLDTCEKYHRAIDAPLDELDPTFGAAYTLNVSSPGLDRPLKTERDFARVQGQKVEVKLYAPLMGKKFFEGTLTSFDANAVTLTVTEKGVEQTYKFALTQIAKMNKAIDFS